MSRETFINQLEALGYNPQELQHGFISIEYKIIKGRFKDMVVEMAFENPCNFPLTPAHGPHFKAMLLPIVGAGNRKHPYGGIHNSPLGTEWQHWSRPYVNWNQTDKTVKTYLEHIKNLLNFH